ncbi:MAG TPA: hypothetical protein HA362_01610 [Nanoarchaeota archaeon]|nr:hypothetical protein [Nanoarchaeota archaeon]
MKKTITLAMAALLLAPFVIAEALTPVLEADITVFRYDTAAMELKVGNGRAAAYNNESGDYRLAITDSAGNIVWSRDYDLKFVELTNPPSSSEYEMITEKIAYDSRMYELAFYHDSMPLIRRYLDFCDANTACDRKENAVSCPMDCPASDKDNVCINSADGLCDPDCMKGIDPDCTALAKKKMNLTIVSIVIIAAILLILACILGAKHRELKRLAKKAKERYHKAISELKEMGKPVKKKPHRNL